ncbi:MAG: ATP-binding protein [Lachnospiraceae bacterium]|nr:ATP-binding protein [Lachnospiraceae bacterium]
MKSITVPAETKYLEKVQGFVREELDARGCEEAITMQIELCIEEVFVNISSYAYNPEIGDAEIRCEVSGDPLEVTIQFLDGGVPFNPLAKPDADTSPEATMNRIGGLGIFLVKKMMDKVDYEYDEGKNVLTISKKIQ